MTRHSETIQRLARVRPDELLPDPDPTRRERYLAMAMSHPQAPPDPVSVPAAGPSMRRTTWWSVRPAVLALGSGGLAVVAAAVAISVTLAGTATPGAAPAGGAPALLLAAATRAETSPAGAPGRYWLAKSEIIVPTQVGPAGNRYTVNVRTEEDVWLSTSGRDQQGLVEQPLGATPATPADQDAWRRDGSPTQWQLPGVHKAVGTPNVISATPGAITSWVGSIPGWAFVTGGPTYTVAQMLAVPTDPAGLRAFLLKTYKSFNDPLAGGGQEQFLYDAGMQILISLPSTPAIRGAAYRLLASLPDVRNVGPLTMPGGGRGEAIALTETQAPGTFDSILVFDPATGSTVGTEHRMISGTDVDAPVPPGTIYQYEVVTHIGWTDSAPPPRQLDGHPAAAPTHS
jgi:hypothetical protein